MVYKLTLLKDLPYISAGFSFYLRGKERSIDGERWGELLGKYKEIKKIQHLENWVKTEETDIKDVRPHLETLYPNETLYTLQEASGELGWEYEEEGTGIKNVKCCGREVEIFDVFGSVLEASCSVCGKMLCNKIDTSKNVVTMIDFGALLTNKQKERRGNSLLFILDYVLKSILKGLFGSRNCLYIVLV